MKALAALRKKSESNTSANDVKSPVKGKEEDAPKEEVLMLLFVR